MNTPDLWRFLVGQECPTLRRLRAGSTRYVLIPCRTRMSDPHGHLPRIWFNPEPGIFFRSAHQSSPDWVLADVFQFLFQAFLAAQDVVEGFFLPDWACAVGQLVHTSG